MTQKTNEQGQKVYEVLSEEYIRLKECELHCLITKKQYMEDALFAIPNELYTKIEELESHIEDLKAEL
jgi:hypothetical protein